MTTTLGRVPPTLEVEPRNRDRLSEVATRHGAICVGVFGSVARGGAILPGHVRESVLKAPGHVGEGSAKEAIFGRGMFRKQS
ncbi:MAG: hypothetical protein EBU62_04990 [Proteobacteria bacterium]|nr:hypothetical protein [Pseudomonadota bacterium]